MKEGRLPAKEFFRDIFTSMKMSGKRSFLSGAVTVWGVFIFVVIVGTSNGIDRGNRSNYDFWLSHGMISVYPGEISTPAKGLVKGRRISLKMEDAQDLKESFASRCEGVYPRKQFYAPCVSPTGSARLLISDFRHGLDEKYLTFPAGRCLSEAELISGRRVCLIPDYMAGQLYDNAADAIGKTLDISGVPFTVKGVYTPVHNMKFRTIFVPFEAAMSIFGKNDELSSIDIKLNIALDAEENYRLKKDIRSMLCFRKGIDPEDISALRLDEQIDFFSSQEKFINSIRLFTVVLGLLSLLMGILGVSSIIHLSVKERVKEIAIRLVCGSSESSIFFLILGESVMTMLVFGAVGILLGAVVLRVGTMITARMNVHAVWVMIGDMSVSWQLLLSSTALIVACGLIAGFAPARKAVSVKINDAMNYE